MDDCPELDAKAEWVGRNGDGVGGNGEEENVGLEKEVGWSCKLGHVHDKYHLNDISSSRRNRSKSLTLVLFSLFIPNLFIDPFPFPVPPWCTGFTAIPIIFPSTPPSYPPSSPFVAENIPPAVRRPSSSPSRCRLPRELLNELFQSDSGSCMMECGCTKAGIFEYVWSESLSRR